MTESHDPITGEIVEEGGTLAAEVRDWKRSTERAADGAIIPGPTASTGNFLDLIEDGAFSAEVYDKLRDLGAKITDICNATGNKVKGKLKIEIELAKDGEHFTLTPKYTIVEPELPRPKSVMWTDQAGDFTRFPPSQTQMFGTARAVRRV